VKFIMMGTSYSLSPHPQFGILPVYPGYPELRGCPRLIPHAANLQRGMEMPPEGLRSGIVHGRTERRICSRALTVSVDMPGLRRNHALLRQVRPDNPTVKRLTRNSFDTDESLRHLGETLPIEIHPSHHGPRLL
jgi:hypothetical protein